MIYFNKTNEDGMSNKQSGGGTAGCIIAIIVAVIAGVLLFIYRPWEAAPSVGTYALTTNVIPSGAGSVSPSGGEYQSAQQVTLTANPSGGYAFDHWSGSASGTTPTITVIMYSDKTLTANFRTTSEPTHELGKRERYFVDRKVTGYDSSYKPEYEDIYMDLTTVAYWEKGTQGTPTIWTNPLSGFRHPDWLIEFETDQARWVVNWYYEARASTPLDSPDYESYLNLVVWPKATFDRYFRTADRGVFGLPLAIEADTRGPSNKGVHCTVVHQAGEYVIVVTPSAVEDIVDWWVTVGAE